MVVCGLVVSGFLRFSIFLGNRHTFLMTGFTHSGIVPLCETLIVSLVV